MQINEQGRAEQEDYEGYPEMTVGKDCFEHCDLYSGFLIAAVAEFGDEQFLPESNRVTRIKSASILFEIRFAGDALRVMPSQDSI
ncbi:MAG: hypothetical protein WAM66_06200 [Acidobacteriaceae bacterium]